MIARKLGSVLALALALGAAWQAGGKDNPCVANYVCDYDKCTDPTVHIVQFTIPADVCPGCRSTASLTRTDSAGHEYQTDLSQCSNDVSYDVSAQFRTDWTVVPASEIYPNGNSVTFVVGRNGQSPVHIGASVIATNVVPFAQCLNLPSDQKAGDSPVVSVQFQPSTNPPHICVIGPHASHICHTVFTPDTVSPAPDINVNVFGAFFDTGAISITTPTSIDVTLTGAAPGTAILSANCSVCNWLYAQTNYTVVDVDKFTAGAHCGCTPSRTDKTQAQEDPADANMVVDMQAKDKEGGQAKIDLRLSWQPVFPSGQFLYQDACSGSFPGNDVPTNNYVNKGVGKHILAWFDCDGLGGFNDEPRRDLWADVCYFNGLTFQRDPTVTSCDLGAGRKGTAIVSTWTRDLRWRLSAIQSEDNNAPVKVRDAANTTDVLVANGPWHTGTCWSIQADADTGRGTVTIEVRDSIHNCVYEQQQISVGCDSCSGGSACGTLGNHRERERSIEFSMGPTVAGGKAAPIIVDFPPYTIPPEDSPATHTNLPPSGANGSKTPDPDQTQPQLAHRRYEYVDGERKPVPASDSKGVSTTLDAKGRISRALAQDGFVDFTYDASNRFIYAMQFYRWSDVANPTNGFIVGSNAVPFVTYGVIQHPDATTSVITRLEVIEVRSGRSNLIECAYTGTDADHTRTTTTGSGLRSHSKREQTEGSQLTCDIEVTGASSNLVSKRQQVLGSFPWGQSIVSEVVYADQGDFAAPKQLVETWTYYAVSNAPGYGQINLHVNADGSWEHFEYDDANRQTVVTRGFKDGGTNSQDVVRTFHCYTLFANELANYMVYTPRTTIETTRGKTNSVTYRAFYAAGALRTEVTERAVSPGSPFGAPGNLRTETTISTNDERVQSVKHPDGRLDTYSYTNAFYTPGTPGAFVEAAEGECLWTMIKHGTTNSPDGLANRTTASVTIADPLGRQVLAETLVYDGAEYIPIDWTATFSDELGHATNVVRSTGASVQATWACCGKDSEKDETGIEYNYLYDALRRLDLRIKKGATTNEADTCTFYTYDAEGRQLGQVVQAGSLSQVTTNVYDLAGRLVWSRDPDGIETTYIHDGVTETTIRAGLTNVTVRYLDGKAKYTVVNGVIKSWNDYGVNDDGTQWTMTYTGPAGTNSPMWTRTTTDFLGRTILEERPGFWGTLLSTRNAYDSASRLSLSATFRGSTRLTQTLYEYNELGEEIRSGLDVNTNSTLDLVGPDRVNESASWYEQDASNNMWQVRTSILYPTDGSSVPVTNSIQRTQLSGLGSSSGFGILTSVSSSADLLGNQTASRTYVDRDSKTTTQTTAYPDSSNAAVSVSVNGLTQHAISKTGIRSDYGYDSLGRQVSALQGGPGAPRIAGSYTIYNTLGQVACTMDAASNATTYTFDEFGRRIAATDALSNTIYTAYDAEGRVTNTWGATYPVGYVYDAYGRMVAMQTWRDTNSTPDVTRWLYDETTGLLTNKLYADLKGPAYTYTGDGKLASRTWARGVTTDYGYDSLGQMTMISYSDGTRSVAFAYDRLGRQSAITDGTGTRTFGYDDALRLAAETNAFGVLERTYDSFGRSLGLALDGTPQAAYGYDGVGRFAQVAWRNGGTACTATYAYVQGLLAGYDLLVGTNLFQTRKAFEPQRDLIAAVSNAWNSVAVSPYAYLNDALARRVRRVDNASVTNDFGYNLRSELTSAVMGTNTYGYLYDPIGNRQAASNNAEALTYAANALNQYTNIADGVTNAPTYDDDGNLTNYNGWTFAWDAENRLIAAVNGSTVVSNSYDYMSRRVSKTANGTTRQFLYDGWAMIRESSGTTTNSFAYGLDLSGSLQGAGTIGGILAACLNGTNAVCVYDANGNLTDLVGDDGLVIAHYEYDPYGNVTAKSGPLADANPFRFSTKYTDDETGLLYYGLRFYSPALGRWVNRDPSGEMGGANLCRFVSNDPTTHWDYLGLLARVILDPPDISSITPVLQSKEQMMVNPLLGNKLDYRIDYMKIGGWTVYHDLAVSCWCECPDPGKTKFRVVCKLSWRATIYLNQDWDRKAPYDPKRYTAIGAYGHEQKHVKASKTRVDKQVADPLRADREGGWHVSDNACMNPHAAHMKSLYTLKLSNSLGTSSIDQHKNAHPGDPAYSDEPDDGEMIDQSKPSPPMP